MEDEPLPLATLSRPSGIASFRVVRKPDDAENRSPERVRTFPDAADGEAYLSYWQDDASAMRRLRKVLHALGPAGIVAGLTDRQVLRALARRLADRTLVVSERGAPRLYLNVRTAFERARATRAHRRPPGAGSRRLVRPPTPALPGGAPALPQLLPLLETVQIEGARVLPEILQSLEQIDLSLTSLDLAALSLEPAPTEVPSISRAMTSVSDSILSTIEDV
jgi:hypothetical protein